MKFFTHVALFAFITAELVGCATPPPVYGVFQVDQEIVKSDITPLDVQLSKRVGENTYAPGIISTYRKKTAELLSPVNVELDLGHRLNLNEGSGGVLQKRSFNGASALCFRTSGAGSAYMSLTEAGAALACLVDTENDGYFDYAMFATREKHFPLVSKVPYRLGKIQEDVSSDRSTFRQELIYQGVANGVVRFSYREFFSGTARPAFTQELTYDLPKDGRTVITFRDLVIQINAATNKKIDYIVKQHLK
jgi:hypothetical protein